MKISTAAASATLFMASVDAFTPSPTFTQRTAQTSLSLLPDPVALTSAIETSSVITTIDPAETLGQLALLSSVGFGVAYSKTNQKDWSYEYKLGNEMSDLAMLEESPDTVRVKADMAKALTVAKDVTESQKEFFGIKATAPAVVEEPKVVPAAAKPVAASKELLESTEKAKAAVVKKGVQDTKDKISSKASTPAPAPVEEKEEAVAVASTSTEVATTKKPGGKRRFVKGVALIAAATAVTLGRNVIKAYLGKGML